MIKLFYLGSVLAALALAGHLDAQPQSGQAEVRGIMGGVMFSTAGDAVAPLRVGMVLNPGSVIKTSGGSAVDLYLGEGAGTVRMTANSTLAIDKLVRSSAGAGTEEVQLYLPEGTLLGFGNKMTDLTKYQVKVANGIAGIHSAGFRINSQGFVVVIEGELAFAYVPSEGKAVPLKLHAPPAVYFSPVEGVVQAPRALVSEVANQSKGKLKAR
jgi:hypothetical protein